MTNPCEIPEDGRLREEGMVHEDRWQEVHRLAAAQVSVSEIARTLTLDRKTVRRCLRLSSCARREPLVFGRSGTSTSH